MADVPGYGSSSYNTLSTSAQPTSFLGSVPWGWIVGGIVVAAVIGLVVWFVVGRAETRPIQEGFQGPVTGTSSFPCSRMSKEADALYSMFLSRPLNVGEEGKLDLSNLSELLAKMSCMKQDLMAPQQTITSSRELGFATHSDIQPVADLTARCFSKTVPERDLSLQFSKWRDFGLDLIRRLCTAGRFTEEEVVKAEKLFIASWKDAMDVANTQCLNGKAVGAWKTSPHEPAAQTPEEVTMLRDYDGYY